MFLVLYGAFYNLTLLSPLIHLCPLTFILFFFRSVLFFNFYSSLFSSFIPSLLFSLLSLPSSLPPCRANAKWSRVVIGISLLNLFSPDNQVSLFAVEGGGREGGRKGREGRYTVSTVRPLLFFPHFYCLLFFSSLSVFPHFSCFFPSICFSSFSCFFPLSIFPHFLAFFPLCLRFLLFFIGVYFVFFRQIVSFILPFSSPHPSSSLPSSSSSFLPRLQACSLLPSSIPMISHLSISNPPPPPSFPPAL